MLPPTGTEAAPATSSRVEPEGTATPAPATVLPLVDALPRLAAFALVAIGLVGTPLALLDRFDRLPVLLGGGALLVLLELAGS
jgi:hypothetical protein